MSGEARVYIAGMGMITPVGANLAMTTAAVRAGISAYATSGYYDQVGRPITMASVPAEAIHEIQADLVEGDRFNLRHHRVVKMAIHALREACVSRTADRPFPLFLAAPEGQADEEGLSPLVANLEVNCKPWVDSKICRVFASGRASGFEAIDFAFHHLNRLPADVFIVGGSDSYQDYSRLGPLSDSDRLLVPGALDAFVPGEAAAFLLLSRKPEFAMVREGHVVALNAPGIADESGHMHGEHPYRGDGLDAAFKQALGANSEGGRIHSIYSSMNGENFWAKEYGVAFMRNRKAFREPVAVEHPADCYGDLGAATATVLIGLAAEHLFRDPQAGAHLVYGSSDYGTRGAIVLESFSIEHDN